MSESCQVAIRQAEKQRELIFRAADWLWKHPETGYKEWQTHAFLKAEYEKLGYTLVEAGNIPGFYTEIDTGRPGPTVLIMAEMDALIVESHPSCDPETKAVHACGHCCQSAGLLGVAAALKEPGALDGLSGKIRLMEVPAEEAIEIDFREDLRKQGVIRYFGGKQEFLARGMMEGVDLTTLIHTSVRAAGTADATPGSNGFLLKSYTFRGKSAHAASPWSGVNALYAATQALSAINAVRETFEDSDHIRVHPIITKGGTVVNAIPEEVTVENYIRGASLDAIEKADERVSRALAGSALSMGANVSLRSRPGYLPQKNDPALCALALDAAELVLGEGKAEMRKTWGNGCSDMGDMTALFPTAYLHIGGAKGKGHGADYDVSDTESLCVGSAKILMAFLQKLLENGAAEAKKVVASYQPVFQSREDYCKAMDAMIRDGDAIEYNEDGTATVRWK